jgi:hypothetical protein
MAKFKLSAEQLQVLLLVVIPIAEELAAKTTTKLDDKLVAALKAASTNPILLALVMSLLSGGEPSVKPEDPSLSAMESGMAEVLCDNADQVAGLFSLVA